MTAQSGSVDVVFRISSAEPVRELNRAEQLTAIGQATLRVLVVDDDPTVMSLVRLTLADEGYDVRTASDGREALRCVDEFRPDVIVLDLEMPEMDGRSYFRALRESGVDVPVLVLSAYGAHDARRELGAEAALDKPFDPSQLLRSLRRIARESASEHL